MFDQVYELQKIISNRKEDYQNYKDYLAQGPFQWPDKWRLFCFGLYNNEFYSRLGKITSFYRRIYVF